MMDFETLASSSDSIGKLQCTLCKNYLSYFPIYLSTNKQSICGRCVLPPLSEANDYTPNDAFEAVSQFVKFPCRYKNEGCFENVLPKDIPLHEKNCPYRVIECPTVNFTQCNWEGPRTVVLQHCQDKHDDIILRDGQFETDLSHSHQYNFMEYRNELFIITRNFDSTSQVLQCSVSHLENAFDVSNYPCQLSIGSGDRNLSVEFHKSAYREINFSEIFLESIRIGSNDTSVVLGKISIGKMICNEADAEKIKLEMVSILLCSICSEYALPPIYQCWEGYLVFCEECKEQHSSTCSACEEYGSSRNITADNIAKLLNYPCKYQKNGCNVISKPSQIKKHQASCPYGNRDCPLIEYVKCQWNGFGKDIINHIQNNHEDMINSSPAEITVCVSTFINTHDWHNSYFGCDLPLESTGNVYCKIIKFSDRLFRLSFAKIGNRYCWTVQVIGDVEQYFKYEIEIININNDRRLLIRKPCGPLTKKCQLFTSKSCQLTNQVYRFLLEENLTFKVHIFKIV